MFCRELHLLLAQIPRLHVPFEKSAISDNGIYVLFERGETGHTSERIVRVGTHKGNKQLASRLQQHFLKENKDRSIFRKNIGRAMLELASDPFLNVWERDFTSRKARVEYSDSLDRAKLNEVERAVSRYIQENFSFVVIKVEEKEERLRLESRIISTVSSCDECGPSGTWLGLSSPKEKVRKSGLWLVNELYKEPLEESDLAFIRFAILANSPIATPSNRTTKQK